MTATITAANKILDGTTAATITGCTLDSASGNSGKLAGDDVGCSASNAQFGTAGVGPSKQVTATVSLTGSAADNYRLTSGTASTTANITYKWDGFRSPVDNPGTGATPVFNSAKAGQSIPMKFSLSGNQGLGVIAAGYPKVTSVNCVSSATVDPLEAYAASTANGGLNYDSSIDQYNYVWKTQSTYAGKCYKFDMQLIDGTSHVAYFKFIK